MHSFWSKIQAVVTQIAHHHTPEFTDVFNHVHVDTRWRCHTLPHCNLINLNCNYVTCCKPCVGNGLASADIEISSELFMINSYL